MHSYLDELQAMGLSKNQAGIYSQLIRKGSMSGSALAQEVGVSRQLTYKVIDELVALGLCEKKNQKGSVSRFEPTHPSKLVDILADRQRALDVAQKQLGAVIDHLVSDYNLEQGRPSIRFVEGPRGVEKALMDTLNNKDEVIYTYVDPDLIVGKIEEIDTRYITQRLKKGCEEKNSLH